MFAFWLGLGRSVVWLFPPHQSAWGLPMAGLALSYQPGNYTQYLCPSHFWK